MNCAGLPLREALTAGPAVFRANVKEPPPGVDAETLFSACGIVVSSRCWNSAPSAAIPVAIPTWRNVLEIPAPMPLRWGGTTPTAVDAITGFAIPMPTPASRNPGSSAVHSESAVSPPISSSAMPTSRRPVPSRKRTGMRAESCPEIGATKNETSVRGMKRRPASSGS